MRLREVIQLCISTLNTRTKKKKEKAQDLARYATHRSINSTRMLHGYVISGIDWCGEQMYLFYKNWRFSRSPTPGWQQETLRKLV